MVSSPLLFVSLSPTAYLLPVKHRSCRMCHIDLDFHKELIIPCPWFLFFLFYTESCETSRLSLCPKGSPMMCVQEDRRPLLGSNRSSSDISARLKSSVLPIVFAPDKGFTHPFRLNAKTSERRSVGTCEGPDIIVNGLCPIAATSVLPLFQLSFLYTNPVSYLFLSFYYLVTIFGSSTVLKSKQ